MFVSGVVLAAGGSRRLGVPKQLLSYKSTTLLGASLATARRSGFGQIVLTLGPALEEIRAGVFLDDLDLALNPDYSTGCASSIRSALEVIDPRAEAMVLLLGDQPEVEPEAVRRLVVQAAHSPIAICRYEDGLGHPMWFQRRIFDELGSLHGDKAVWKLIESGLHPVLEVRTQGTVPLDVDTWEDYEELLARVPAGFGQTGAVGDRKAETAGK